MLDSILIVDNDDNFIKPIASLMAKNNFKVVLASDEREGLEKAKKEKPSLIIVDISVNSDSGFSMCQKLREDRLTSLVPIVFVSKNNLIEEKTKAFELGADDFLTKPVNLDELTLRIRTILKRFRQSLACNPLTGFPGNISIEEEIKRRLQNKEKLAVCYLDLDNFKSFNDRYGYEKGDEVIQLLAGIINKTTELYGEPYDFIGHIGGDDFILITNSEKIEEICGYIIKEFDKEIIAKYSSEDREKGYISIINRQGQLQLFPIITLSIGIAHNKDRDIASYIQVAEIATELKKYAKTKKGSSIAIDRRIK